MNKFILLRSMLAMLGALGLQPQALLAADLVKMDEKQIRSLGIETRLLQAQQLAQAMGLPAQVVIPNSQVRMVSAPVAGMVQTLAVAAHEPVKQGQLLARLQSTGLVEMQREFINAATEAQLARDSLKRDEALFKEGIIAESRYLATKGRHAQSMASASERRQALRLYGMPDSAINALQSGKGMSSTLNIVSPINGVVLEQMVTVGGRVEASAPLFKVAQLSPLWLEIQVPLAQASAIKPGMPVSVLGATGKVISLGNQVNPANQTVMVRAEIAKGTSALRPGQLVEVRIQAASAGGNQWVVPTASLVRQQGKAYLFVQVAGGFQMTEVSLLGETADSATVTGAFKGTERIAVQGIAALKAVWAGLGGE